MLETKYDHQSLMNEVYAILQSKDNLLSRIEVAEKLGPIHKLAVCLGNFNYQVGNGGVSQWVFNSYAEEDALYILKVMQTYILTFDNNDLPQYIETAKSIVKLLEELTDEVDPTRESWNVSCQECDGHGSYVDYDEAESDWDECYSCNGEGMVSSSSYSDACEIVDFDKLEKHIFKIEPITNKEYYFIFEDFFQNLINILSTDLIELNNKGEILLKIKTK